MWVSNLYSSFLNGGTSTTTSDNTNTSIPCIIPDNDSTSSNNNNTAVILTSSNNNDNTSAIIMTNDDIDDMVNEIVNGEEVNEYFFNCAGLISNLNYVKQVIERKNNANSIDLMRRNILHHACRWGNLNIVKYAISKGVLVNLKDSFGNTPLHYCCEEGYTEIVTTLLHHPNIKATVKNKEGATPKKKAQYSGYVDVVQLLERYLGNIYIFKENLKNQVIDVEETYSHYKLSDISIRIKQYD